MLEGAQEVHRAEISFLPNNVTYVSFDKTNVLEGVLPANWSIVQISSQDLLVSRFRALKAAQPLSSNPGLSLVRLCGGRVRVSRLRP